MGIVNNELSGAAVEEQTVGTVVAANSRAAKVFTKYGIDFCCGGDKSIRQACAEKGIQPQDLWDEVLLATEQGEADQGYAQWPIDFLADYIVNQHHAYAKKSIPQIKAMVEAVVAAHGEVHPEVHTIAAIWQALSGELIMHMQKEELMLFPYIKKIVRSKADGSAISPPRFGSVASLIETMENEHESTGGQLAELEQLTNNFVPPEDACFTFKTLYADLDEFQQQTKMHVHLENNILFPKAIALEKEL